MKLLKIIVPFLLVVLLAIGCEMNEAGLVEPGQKAPTITNIIVKPDTISAGDDVTISAKVTDEDGDLNTVIITIDGTESSMVANGNIYSHVVSSVDTNSHSYFITATDKAENKTVSNTMTFKAGSPPPIELVDLVINEFMASNDKYDVDGNGTFPDWIEIYNPNAAAVDLGGYYISDKVDDPTVWQIPTTDPSATTIPAKGFIVLFADKNPDAGVLHVNIKLSGSGEAVVLSKPDETLVDSRVYEAQTTDVSEGRETDGADTWVNFDPATPGQSNQ